MIILYLQYRLSARSLAMLASTFILGCSGGSSSSSPSSASGSQNSPPSIHSVTSTAQQVQSGATFSLTSNVSDPDGDPLTFTWSEASSFGAQIASPGASLTDVTAPIVPQGQQITLRFKLSVSDGVNQAVESSEVSVTVEGPPSGGGGGSGGTGSDTLAVTSMTMEYDALGRLSRVVFNGGKVLSYSYDADGNITAIEGQ